MATFKITTFGCQMNKSDSERLRSVLVGFGLTEVNDEKMADVLMYNTCSVRQMSEDRMYGIAHNLDTLKKQKPELIVGVTGCMAGRDADGKIRARLGRVDLFFPTEELVYLPKRLSEINPNIISSDRVQAESEYEHYLKIAPSYTNAFQAYIAVSNGCNKFCTYCVVPYARGRQKDRSLKDVLHEVKECASHGVREITLLGQSVNFYNPPDKENFSAENPYDRLKNSFAALMWELNNIHGIQRIHFTAAHPQYMDDQTLDALTLPKQVHYLHLPVQSGSNEVLARMNRPYTREYFIERIGKLRARMPRIALGTDIIVGFCGETEAQFEETLDLYRLCDFDISYNAQYSVRSGTAAARMYKDDISRAEKKRRWQKLQRLMEETVLRKNRKYIDTTVSVLVDGSNKGLCSGNSREMKRVTFRGDDSLVGTIVDVKIDRVVEWILYGSIAH